MLHPFGTVSCLSGRSNSYVQFLFAALIMDLLFITHLFIFSISADLAKYEIGKVLGSGSFGQVVAATRKSDNKPVCSSYLIREF